MQFVCALYNTDIILGSIFHAQQGLVFSCIAARPSAAGSQRLSVLSQARKRKSVGFGPHGFEVS